MFSHITSKQQQPFPLEAVCCNEQPKKQQQTERATMRNWSISRSFSEWYGSNTRVSILLGRSFSRPCTLNIVGTLAWCFSPTRISPLSASSVFATDQTQGSSRNCPASQTQTLWWSHSHHVHIVVSYAHAQPQTSITNRTTKLFLFSPLVSECTFVVLCVILVCG